MQLLQRRFGKDVVLLHDADGAPSVDGYDGHISISHCNGVAVLATHQSIRIGIDIERKRTQLINIKHKYLTAAEMEEFTSIEQLLWAWTAKEAVYKSAGISGLSLTAIELNRSDMSASVTSLTSKGQLKFRLYSTYSDEIMTTVAIPE
jgi:phosphopantetheinyl transferase